MTVPNFVGVNCTVNGNTLTTTSGWSVGTPGNGFTGGAFSETGYISVSVSAAFGSVGSSAMLIGLNTSPVVPAPIPVPSPFQVPVSTYQLYFHSDSAQYVVTINGQGVFVPATPPAGGDIGTINYTGQTVVFLINNFPIYVYQIPLAQIDQLLYVTWTSFYLGGTSTLNVVPFGSVLASSPNVTPYSNLITSEHNQKPNFMSLIGSVVGAAADAVVSTQAIQPAFNLETAIGAQLDVLGLWIGQSRKIDNILIVGFFGFSEVSTGLPDGLQETFGELGDASIGGSWFSLGQADSGSTILADPAYLTILKAKIVKNQWDGTISGMEQALFFIVGVECSINDAGNLTLQINVPLPITPLEEALLESLDLIPRPAGVRITSITFA